MIGIETGPDNLQLADFNWTKEWGVNFGKADNESGVSHFISEPGCDAVLHQRRHNKGQNNEREQNKTERDRKSTRLNSSHRCISYAVFCLKKKKETRQHKHTGMNEC